MKHIIKIIILLFLFQSCSQENEIVQEITNDFISIKGSAEEISQKYDTCIAIFGDFRKGYDGRKIIKCEMNNDDIQKIDALGLRKTESLLKNGYVIKIDASCHYNIYFERKLESTTMGVIRYSAWYKNIISSTPNTIGIINPNHVEVLKVLDKKTSVVKIVEYAE
jgi:hypothetical protein